MKSLLMLLFCFTFTILSAGATGYLRGRVTDENGKPIKFANLVITKSELVAQTNKRGKYRISQIQRGQYSVTCSKVGYQSQKITFVGIQLHKITILNFRLKVMNSENEGIKITESRFMYPGGLSSYATTDRMLAKARIYATIDLLQPGVYENNGEIYIRGGKPNEVVYFIDGVSTNDPLQGGSALTIDKDAIQEIKIMTGGYPAEFGNAQSGIINIITKTGTKYYHGKLEFSSDHLLSEDNMNSDKINFALSGPLIPNLKKRITFIINGSGSWHDYDNYDFKGDNIFDFDTGNRTFNLRNGNIKINYTPKMTSRFVFSARADSRKSFANVNGNIFQQHYELGWQHFINANNSFSIKGIYHSKQQNEGTPSIEPDEYIVQNDEFDLYDVNEWGLNYSGVDFLNTSGDAYYQEDNIESYGIMADFKYRYNYMHSFKTGLEIVSYQTERDKISTPWKVDSYRFLNYLQENSTAVDSVYNGYEMIEVYGEEDVYTALKNALGETFGIEATP